MLLTSGARRAATLAALLAACLVACDASGIIEPQPLPAPVGEAEMRQVRPGEFEIAPVSASVTIGVPYAFEVYTHCGFTPTSFDFDGTFWTVVGPSDDGSANPPAGIGNPEDAGVIVLRSPGEAAWTSAAGIEVALVRAAPGPVVAFPCD